MLGRLLGEPLDIGSVGSISTPACDRSRQRLKNRDGEQADDEKRREDRDQEERGPKYEPNRARTFAAWVKKYGVG